MGGRKAVSGPDIPKKNIPGTFGAGDEVFHSGKQPAGFSCGLVLCRAYSSEKPMGFMLCQRQESRHMSTRDFSAVQPSFSADLAGSA